MSVHSNWPEAQQPLGGPEPPARGGGRYVLVLLALVAAVVLCLTGVLVAGLLRSNDAPPTLPAYISVTTAVPQVMGTVPAGTPGQPKLDIQPQQGYVNTLITVTGVGWSPGEPVFIFLRTPQGDAADNYAYAAAVADDRGSFRTAVTFPSEGRWSDQSVATVAARGSRSGLEASARFDLVAPTATSTVPLPTLPPTQPATATPLVTNTPPPTPTATPTSTPPLVITDWLGEYFVGRDLAGAPALVRNELSIDFNWGLGSPGAGVPVDGFSARWTRQLNFREAYYRFAVWADDGIRVWIDGELLIDEWQDGVIEGLAVERFVPGGTHSLRVEYYENTGGAMARFLLERVTAPTATPSPTSTAINTATPTLTPTPTATPPPTVAPPGQVLPGAWQGDYFTNPLFAGAPALTRTDAEINFDWGLGSPAEGLPNDAFSVRWTGSVWLPEGRYRYSLTADDVARLIIDGQPVLGPQQGRAAAPLQAAEVFLSEGTHFFQVEYVELTGTAFVRLTGEAVASGDAGR